MKSWTVQEAQANFCELAQLAATEGPQAIKAQGKEDVVVLSRRDFDRLSQPKPGFVEFLRTSPLMGVELNLERDSSLTR